jgi:hypothetical protein
VGTENTPPRPEARIHDPLRFGGSLPHVGFGFVEDGKDETDTGHADNKEDTASDNTDADPAAKLGEDSAITTEARPPEDRTRPRKRSF